MGNEDRFDIIPSNFTKTLQTLLELLRILLELLRILRICLRRRPECANSRVPESSAAPRAGFSPADRRLGSGAARGGTAGEDGFRTGRPNAN